MGQAEHQPKRWARRFALQAIYQWQLTDQPVGEIAAQFSAQPDFAKTDNEYFRELLFQVDARIAELDEVIGARIDRTVGEIDSVERAILRYACYELVYRQDLPYKVVINEAVLLAKKFGAEHGHTYVNGVLDNIARRRLEDGQAC